MSITVTKNGDCHPRDEKSKIGFLNKNEYKIFDRTLNFNDKKIYFAVHYINSPMGIWDKLLGFEIKDNNINRILAYEDYKFINSNSEIFLNFSPEKYPGIYGFRFDYPNNETFPGLILSGYFNEDYHLPVYVVELVETVPSESFWLV